MFNSNLRIERCQFGNGQTCLVIDDALVDPDSILRFVQQHRSNFSKVDFNYYPGIFLPPPIKLEAALEQYFNAHVRRYFDARRLIKVISRFSMVTLAPRDLQPMQCICHRDRPLLDSRLSIQASVLYLFRDESLGGTSFYEPVRSTTETNQLFKDAANLGNSPRAVHENRRAPAMAAPRHTGPRATGTPSGRRPTSTGSGPASPVP